MSKKLNWKVGTKPTGKFKSFSHWSWPMASSKKGGDGEYLAMVCPESLNFKTSYTPDLGKAEKLDFELLVQVAQPITLEDGRASFKWRTLSKRFFSLAEAKAAAQEFFDKNPTWWRD